jgi:hypothetical protein
MEAEKLLSKVASGKSLSSGEVDEVADILDRLRSDDDLRKRVSLDDEYSMILCLGQVDVVRYAGVIAHYLNCKDPQTVCLALRLLCDDAGLRKDYLERLVDFALGTSWDSDHDVQVSALGQLGEYIRDEKDCEEEISVQSKSLLLQLFAEEDLASGVRKAAYFGLLRAAGTNWEEMPSAYKQLSFEENSPDIDWVALDKLQNSLP